MQYNVKTDKRVPTTNLPLRNANINMITNKKTPLPNTLVFFDTETDSLIEKITDNVYQIPNITEYTILIFDYGGFIKQKNLNDIDKFILSFSKDIHVRSVYTCDNLKTPIEQILTDFEHIYDGYGEDVGIIAHNGFNFDFFIMHYLTKYRNINLSPKIKKIKLLDSLRMSRKYLPIGRHTNSYLYTEYFLNAIRSQVNIEKYTEYKKILLDVHTSYADVLIMLRWCMYMFMLVEPNPEVHVMYLNEIIIQSNNKILHVYKENEFFDKN